MAAKKRKRKSKLHKHVKRAAVIAAPFIAWLIPSPLK